MFRAEARFRVRRLYARRLATMPVGSQPLGVFGIMLVAEAYRIADLLGRNVFESDREMDQVEIDVAQTPCLVLRFGLRESVFFAVVVVPELGDDEDILTLDESFVDGTLDTLSCFSLVLVVVSTIEETIAYFDGLDTISVRHP
jgi:hypothetical protein